MADLRPDGIDPPSPRRAPRPKPAAQGGTSEGRQLTIVFGFLTIGASLLVAVVWGVLSLSRSLKQAAIEGNQTYLPSGVRSGGGGTPTGGGAKVAKAAAGTFVPRETPEERRADLAMAAAGTPPDSPLAAEVERFLSECSLFREDWSLLGARFDRARFLAEVARCGAHLPDTQELWDAIDIAGGNSGLRLLHLRPLEEGMFRAITMAETDRQRIERWWIRRDPASAGAGGGSWRIVDCDDVHVGLRLSEIHAQHAPLEMLEGKCPLSRITEICDAAVKHAEEQEDWQPLVLRDTRDAIVHLVAIPEPLRDLKRYHIADVIRLASYEEAVRIARKTPDPDTRPFVAWLEAEARSEARDAAGAVPFYERYLALVGESPRARRSLARALWKAGEPQKAIVQWRRLTVFLPDDAEALAARLLCGDEAADRKFVADRLEHLPEAALLDLESRLRSHDEARLRTFVEDCREQLGETAIVLEIVGNEHADADRTREAAEAYRHSVELTVGTDEAAPEARTRRLGAYHLAMIGDHRVVEAYRSGPRSIPGSSPADAADPDRAAAFRQLLDKLSERGDEGERQALLEARLEDVPEDFEALAAAAEIALKQSRERVAEDQWEHALDAADPDQPEQRERAERGRIEALAHQGESQWEQVVTAISGEATCRMLGEALARAGAVDELETVVNRWRERFHQSTWVFQLATSVAEQKGDLKSAATHARRAYELAAASETETEETRDDCRNRLIRIWIEQGKMLEAWRNLPPLDQSLGEVAAILINDGDTDDLKTLLETRPHGDSQPAWHYWAPRYHFDKGLYEGVVKAMDCNCSRTLVGTDRVIIQGLMLRSHLRLGNREKSIEAAQAAKSRTGNSYWPVLASVALGDSNDVLEQFQGGTISPLWTELYDDSDAAPLLDDPRYAPIREAFPPSIGSRRERGEEIVLFYPKPPALSREAIEATILKGSPDLQLKMESVTHEGPQGTSEVFHLTIPAGEFEIVQGATPAFDRAPIWSSRIRDRTLARDIAAHQGWVSVRLIRPIAEDRSTLLRVVRMLAANLFSVTNEATVWYDPTFDLAIRPRNIPGERFNENFLSSVWERAGAGVWLPLGLRQEESRPDWITGAKLGTLWRTLPTGETLEAEIEIGPWTRRETIPVRLERLVPEDSGWTIRVRSLRDSAVRPWIRSGTPLDVGSGMLRNVRPAKPPAAMTITSGR